MEQLKQSCHADNENERELIFKAIAEDSERIKTLEQMISRIYEDMVVGRITEDNAILLLAKGQSEQETLKNRVALNNQRLEKKEEQ